MGASYSYYPDQESPTTPGEKSVCTSELPVLHEDLMDSMEEVLRYPVHPLMELVLKGVEVKEEGPKRFTCKVLLDGEKLDAYGFGDGKGTDKVSFWCMVQLDPDESLLTIDSYTKEDLGDWVTDASDSEATLRSIIKVLKDPVRVEYFWLVKGERQHGQKQADALKLFLDGAVAMIQPGTVRCTLQASKKAAISDKLDDHLTFDQVFDGLTDWSAQFPEAEVNEVSEREVSIALPNSTPGTYTSFTFDRDVGEVCRVSYVAGKVESKQWTVLHQDPLRVEAWVEDRDGVRTTPKRAAKMLEMVLDAIIQKASSWF